MTAISAIIITLNEEKNINECINSLIGVADEIIVIDIWSKNNTPSFYADKRVRYVQTEWKGYAATKNYAKSLARFPLILSIDAPEVLSPTLKASILDVKQNPTHDCYKMNSRTNYCGHWMVHLWSNDEKYRLFFKNKASWSGTSDIEELNLESDCTIGHLNGDLLHYSCRSMKQHMDTTQKFSSIQAIQANSAGIHISYPDIIFGPFAKFLREYLIKRGFLDGYYGFLACAISSFGVFVQNVKLHELNNNKPL